MERGWLFDVDLFDKREVLFKLSPVFENGIVVLRSWMLGFFFHGSGFLALSRQISTDLELFRFEFFLCDGRNIYPP